MQMKWAVPYFYCGGQSGMQGERPVPLHCKALEFPNR